MPAGRSFAFSIVDDTDHATVENVGPVYRLLAELGMRTTKTLWTIPATEPNPYDGSATAAEPAYRDFCRSLQNDGFELAMHGVTMHSATRARIERGIGEFSEWFGAPPRMHINHFRNADNLYWGQARTGTLAGRLIYRAAARQPASQGHVEGSPHFWGDICREHIAYVRDFTFRETDLTRLRAPLAYHDPRTPLIRRRFVSTEGGTLPVYLEALDERRQDELAAAGGVCIMYTHFGGGFVEHGRLNPRFEKLMRRLAGLGGWFVPASELLDALCEHDCPTLSSKQRRHLEGRWISERLRHGAS